MYNLGAIMIGCEWEGEGGGLTPRPNSNPWSIVLLGSTICVRILY